MSKSMCEGEAIKRLTTFLNVILILWTFQEPYSATLRERDSTLQVRMPLDDIPSVVKQLSSDRVTWQQITEKYPKFEQQEASSKK